LKVTETLQKKKVMDNLFVFSMLAPVIVGFLIIRFIPIGHTFVYSFYERNLMGETAGFVGLSNYTSILSEGPFLEAVWNTLYFTVLTTFFGVVFGVILALMVDSHLFRNTNIFQSLYFLPVVISLVPATLIWKCLFDYNYGFINYMLSFIGIERIEWLINPKICIYPVIVVSVWKVVGYNMVIFLVGLRAIPRMYYESMEIDGASGWQTFWRLTVPLLKPITLFVLVISLINNLKVFTQAFVMSQAFQGSGEIVRTIVYVIYQIAFQFYDMGGASASAMLLLVLVFVLTWLQFRIAKD